MILNRKVVLMVEIDMKKIKIFGIVLGVFLIVFVGYVGINIKKINDSKKQTQEFITEYKALEKSSKVSYVIVEINPKLILTVADNKIIDTQCLNDDCKERLKVDVLDKNINTAIETLYDEAKKQGFDVSKGVLVSSTDSEISNTLEKGDYVSYKNIDEKEEKAILEQLNKEENFKNNGVEEYNSKLFQLYKKDIDYNYVYTCNDEGELTCYITEKFVAELPTEISLLNRFYYNLKFQLLMNTLEKFNVEYESMITDVEGLDYFKANAVTGIKFNNIMHQLGVSYYTGNDSDSNFSNVNNIVLEATLENGTDGYVYKTLPLSKFELVSKTYNESDTVILRNYHSMVISAE